MRFLIATVCLLLRLRGFAENYPVKAPEDVKVAVTNVLRSNWPTSCLGSANFEPMVLTTTARNQAAVR